jgi:hypothetical protein
VAGFSLVFWINPEPLDQSEVSLVAGLEFVWSLMSIRQDLVSFCWWWTGSLIHSSSYQFWHCMVQTKFSGTHVTITVLSKPVVNEWQIWCYIPFSFWLIIARISLSCLVDTMQHFNEYGMDIFALVNTCGTSTLTYQWFIYNHLSVLYACYLVGQWVIGLSLPACTNVKRR